MKTSRIAFIPLLITIFLAGCSEEEGAVAPCLNARVIDVADPCSGGVVLELVKEEFSANNSFCGTPNVYKYVTVDNLPDNLKQVGTTFTCQIEARASDKVCIAIYPMYEAATITNICSSNAVVAAER